MACFEIVVAKEGHFELAVPNFVLELTELLRLKMVEPCAINSVMEFLALHIVIELYLPDLETELHY